MYIYVEYLLWYCAQSFVCFFFFFYLSLTTPLGGGLVVLILEMRKLRIRGLINLSQITLLEKWSN